MPTFSDEQVRVPAFARVSELRHRYGGRIPKAELDAGITIGGHRVPLWNYQKGIFKPGVLGRDGAALTIQTSPNSPYEDSGDPESGRFFYKYRGSDVRHHDNIALRNAMLQNRPLIYLVGIDKGIYDAVLPIYVVMDDPQKLEFALMADQLTASVGSADSVMTEVRRAYTTRAVIARLHQQAFRRMVLKAYSDRCSICSLRHLELLDAAHIIPDFESGGIAAVRNGLGLCKIHHSAYDVNILGIDPDARIHIRTDILAERDGPMLKHGLQEVHGTRISLPRNQASRPDKDLLAERFARFRSA
ncbi:MAG: HNH endonuclease [Gemmatimonadetes bacterium]|nr:HNH endonuclease [Gemmatimonadota bacterium]